jgi:hypothetical protein
MSDALPPDVRLIAEFSLDGFVRGGICDFEGRPCLFVSEFLDWDASSGDEFVRESFFLVRIPEGEVAAGERLQGALTSVESDPEWERQAPQAFAEWTQFRRRVLAEATVALRAERNFMESHLADMGERVGPVADSGWVRRGEVSGEIVRQRLRWVAERWRDLAGESGEVSAGEELPF